MEFAAASVKGAQALNEDCCQAWPESGLFISCDGLSVKKGGERAGRAVLECFAHWRKEFDQAISLASKGGKAERLALRPLLRSAFQEASKEIFQLALGNPELQGMCTTADALLVLGTHALIAHVGSGRVYLVRNGQCHQLTEDHTQLAHLRRSGKLAELPPAQHAAAAKLLMRAVGFREEVQVDVLCVELEKNDRFFILTDGVWGALPPEELERFLKTAAAPEPLMGVLHERIGPSSARDNFTSMIVDVLPPPAEAGGAEQKIKMLGTVPAFQYLTYQELIQVINQGELVKLPGGQELWKEGAAGGEMMLILSGSLEIVKSGKKINLLNKGDVVGEMSMLDSAPRSAAAITGGPTNLLAFPRESLFALFREEPELAVKFLWGVTMEMNKRLRAASEQLVGGVASAAPVVRGGPLPFHSEKKV